MTNACLQYLRHGSRGLPDFRRLIAKPMLRDVRMQDVVFAGGRALCKDADAAAGRALVEKLTCLSKEERKKERQDVKAVREEGLSRGER